MAYREEKLVHFFPGILNNEQHKNKFEINSVQNQHKFILTGLSRSDTMQLLNK